MMMNKLIAITLFAVATGCASQKHIAKTQADGEALREDLAATYVEKGAYDAAIPLLRRALLDKPKSAHVHALYGKVLREKGLYPQAERELIIARDLAPRAAKPFAELGILYALERRQPESEAAFRKAVALEARHAPYWNNLGFSLYVGGKVDEAVTCFEKALAIDPALMVAYNNLGFAYGRCGNTLRRASGFLAGGGEVAMLSHGQVYERCYSDRAPACSPRPRISIPIRQ